MHTAKHLLLSLAISELQRGIFYLFFSFSDLLKQTETLKLIEAIGYCITASKGHISVTEVK